MIYIIAILFLITCAIIIYNIFHTPKDNNLNKWKIDNSRKVIDGDYYIEGAFWNIESVCIVPSIIISFTDKEKIEEMAKCFSERLGYCRIYNTLEQEGKLVFDKEHCIRYCNSIHVDYGY